MCTVITDLRTTIIDTSVIFTAIQSTRPDNNSGGRFDEAVRAAEEYLIVDDIILFRNTE